MQPETDKLRVAVGFGQPDSIAKSGGVAVASNKIDGESVLLYVTGNSFFGGVIVRGVFFRRYHSTAYVSIPPSTCSTCPVM